jgi:tRNA(Ile2) C34 agmatinyltransferase TiaS
MDIRMEPKLAYIRVECPRCNKQMKTSGAVFHCSCGELLKLPLVDIINNLTEKVNALKEDYEKYRPMLDQMLKARKDLEKELKGKD